MKKDQNMYGIDATLAQRDEELEKLWAAFAAVPMDPDTARIEEDFLDFPAGTSSEDIRKWFDARYSKGIHHLMYGYDGVDRTDQIARLVYLAGLCFDCDTRSCGLNDGGECKFALVHGRKPEMTEADGCVEGVIDPNWREK